MKCPFCNYTTGFSLEENKSSNTEGDFFCLNSKAERRADYYPYKSDTPVYACPKCCMVFIVKGK